MSDDRAPLGYLLIRQEERLAKDRFHFRRGEQPVSNAGGPVVHHVGEQRLHARRAIPDVIEECAGVAIEAPRRGLGDELAE